MAERPQRTSSNLKLQQLGGSDGSDTAFQPTNKRGGERKREPALQEQLDSSFRVRRSEQLQVGFFLFFFVKFERCTWVEMKNAPQPHKVYIKTFVSKIRRHFMAVWLENLKLQRVCKVFLKAQNILVPQRFWIKRLFLGFSVGVFTIALRLSYACVLRSNSCRRVTRLNSKKVGVRGRVKYTGTIWQRRTWKRLSAHNKARFSKVGPWRCTHAICINRLCGFVWKCAHWLHFWSNCHFILFYIFFPGSGNNFMKMHIGVLETNQPTSRALWSLSSESMIACGFSDLSSLQFHAVCREIAYSSKMIIFRTPARFFLCFTAESVGLFKSKHPSFLGVWVTLPAWCSYFL